ncbi:hypothetical protein SFRURICE_011448 [Spodoptera frugiperda]|nr:hypothetical protein SFRURICE_011448 [Spodoptera frugiperda]
MLRCCGYVWLPSIIFIGTHSLTLVEMVSVNYVFFNGKMCTMNGFLTIDTSYTRTAHFPRTATLRRCIFMLIAIQSAAILSSVVLELASNSVCDRQIIVSGRCVVCMTLYVCKRTHDTGENPSTFIKKNCISLNHTK